MMYFESIKKRLAKINTINKDVIKNNEKFLQELGAFKLLARKQLGKTLSRVRNNLLQAH